ncbi:MAG: ABC transporter permease [Bacteroidota bacterium]
MPEPSIQPPSGPLRLLRWFCKADYLEDIEGDLVERFEKEYAELGPSKARRKFIREVLGLLRPNLIRGISKTQKFSQLDIFKNYFKTTVRSARRELSFTLLTLLCLIIGFAASIYVGLYTKHELGFDTFHEKSDRIYRINQTYIWGDRDEQFGSTGPAVMTAIQEEIPEFETMARVLTFNDAVVTINDNNQTAMFEEGELRGADSTFFDIFTFPFIAGNPKTALKAPHSVVLTASAAKRYFGTTDILGKQMTIKDEDHEHSYLVTGVTEDIPTNSHITFELLISNSSVRRFQWNSDTWWWTTFVTFGLLRPDADPDFVAKKVAQVPAKYLEPFLLRYQGITYEEFEASGREWNLYMQPLLDIHLSSKRVFSRLNDTGDLNMIITLVTIGLLILALSIINFINLSTARSSIRSKEVGMRKIIGTTRKSLMIQFLFESLLFCTISAMISLVLLLIFSDYLSVISGKTLDLPMLISDPLVIGVILAGIVLVSIAAGLYPAFILSSVQPIKIIKGQLVSGAKGSFIRRLLVTVQFAVSMALIASSLIIQDQVRYWLNMDFGFTKDNVIVIQNVERLTSSLDAFQSELLQYSQVKNISFSSDTPPYMNESDQEFYLSGEEEKLQISFWFTDENFFDIYGLEIIAGRGFEKGLNNRNTVVVSRSFAEFYGITDPSEIIGRSLRYYGSNAEIVGVSEDIETEIRFKQLPIATYFEEIDSLQPYTPGRELSIQLQDQLSAAQVNELMIKMEERWSELSPLPLKSYFLDERYESIFETTIDFGQLINFYAMIAAILAGLGLMGLVAYVIERKNKEIGIRKVLGASRSSVWFLLTSEFGRLLLIGFVIASSISWYIMHGWQQDFQYRDTIDPLTFLFAGFIMLAVVLATMGYQTIKAASANPIKYLRDE